MKKSGTLAGLAVVLALGSAFLASAPARATEVTFVGFIDGCFGSACAPATTSGSQSSTLLGLSYSNSSFNDTTSGDFLALGSGPTAPANIDNLGSFTLSGSPDVYNGQAFNLRVTFTAPDSTPGTEVVSALLRGSVTSNNHGGVSISFGGSDTFFTSPAGTFDLAIDNVSVTPGKSAAITASIDVVPTVAAVPEASTWAMMILGFCGLGVVARRRKDRAALA
ncbi:MAG: PEP-CTERM sorting domain-containing protein [Xanthobacteraceae bacterium]|nr:PEP-CTERM sorting domain-containing protein [Xanthobacteraceae bacterium]